MRHFIQYHNSERMGYSASGMTEPHMHTDKSVRYIPSNTVWIISGEGKSPKLFYLAVVFMVNKTTTGTYDHPDFANAAYGAGCLFGETIGLNGISWFETLKFAQQNFKNGLFEVFDVNVIRELEQLASTHVL